MYDQIDPRFLSGTTLDQVDRTGPDLLSRWDRHHEWWMGRSASGIDPYSKVTAGRILPEGRIGTRVGGWCDAINFASQDYLNLASHPSVHEAAKAAIDACGVHSAGSVALMGNTELSQALERRLAAFTGYADCTVFPTGWGAGYGAIRTLVGEGDHVIIDALAHACLHEGARNATRNVHRFKHLQNDEAEAAISRVRAEHPEAGILVVTETLFSMDSDTPDVRSLREICDRHRATLLVDVAHDLGAMGMSGRGCLELQHAIGLPHVLMGSFSKTFASNGGFVACNNPSLKLAMRYGCGPLTFTNALSPVQCAIVLKCIDIVESDDGFERRAALSANVDRMRAGLEDLGIKVLGQPSAIVPAVLGDNTVCRLMTRYATEGGGIVNLVEFPAVARNTSRWRIQMMAGHTADQIDRFLVVAADALLKTRAHSDWLHSTRWGGPVPPLVRRLRRC